MPAGGCSEFSYRSRHEFMLLPRNEKFFQFFSAQADLITRACELLVCEADSANGIQEKCATEIRVIESKGHLVVHGIFGRLNKTFITPIDPQDIHRLATSLDDVLDGIEDAAHRIHAYNHQTRYTSISQVCRLVADCASPMPEALAKVAGH